MRFDSTPLNISRNLWTPPKGLIMTVQDDTVELQSENTALNEEASSSIFQDMISIGLVM